ncbi:MAG TPA: DMT family transporter [Rhodanobacteraceae bacterium]|nr:DMT family transporter [Rhodanobacteraceae bacterium]
MHLLSYALALIAAIINGAAQVMQRKASRDEPDRLEMNPRLFVELARHPIWLLGIAGVVVGSVFQIAALNFGALASVQTIVILELPFALLGATWFLGSRLRKRDWASIGLMTAGTIGLVAFLDPRAGSAADVSTLAWIVALATTLAPILALVFLALRSDGARRAALLGIATGISFALFAALVKGVELEFQSEGVAAVFSSWEIYMAALTAAGSMWLLQNALHAGKLAAAQPGMTLLDPAVSIVWGTLVFHEQVRGGLFVLAAALSFVAIVAGAIALARSPMLEESSGDRGDARHEVRET